MGKYNTIREEIEKANDNDVVKQASVSWQALLVLLAGAGCGIGGLAFDDPNSSMPTLLFTLAALLVLGGAVKLLVSRHRYVTRATKSALKPVTLFYAVQAGDDLKFYLQEKRFDLIAGLKREKDNGVKLQALLADDGQFAAVQVFEYVPYNFEAVTPVMRFHGEEARQLKGLLK